MAQKKIDILIDVVTDRASGSLRSLRASFQDADGAANKFKVGAGAALDSIKANAANLALAGGTALVAFGAKSVSAFQDTALAAGQLRDSLGVTAEEASRLMEVAEDLGIGTETLEKSIGIMNRTATNTPAAFAAIGAELVKNADGTTNVNETFLATIDALKRIPDASARAAAAQKVFGRGWMEMAELIELGADGVRTALDSVEGGKVIDDKEIERARRYRDSMDALKGVYEELSIVVGGLLVDSLSDAAEGAMALKEALDVIPGGAESVKKGLDFSAGIPGLNFVIDQYQDLDEKLDSVNNTYGTLGPSITNYTAETDAANAAADRQENILSDVEIAAGRVESQVDELTDAFSELRDEISEENAYLDAADGFDKVRQAAFDAYTAASTGSADAEAKARDYQRAINDQQLEVLDLIDAIGDVPPETTAKILAALDQGQVDEAERILERLARTRATELLVFPKLIGAVSAKTPFTVAAPGNARGTGYFPGGSTIVGEEGPEVVNLPAGTSIRPAAATAAMAGAGSSNRPIEVNLYIDGEFVTRRIIDHERAQVAELQAGMR